MGVYLALFWRHLRRSAAILAVCGGLWAGALRAGEPAAGVLTVQADEQRTLELPGPARRIVSLAPGATAMLFAAGAGERVVGTSAYSDEPEAARAIERIGDSQGFDLERILALRPDVVVVWSGGTSATQLERLERVGLRLYHHRLARLDDIAPSLLRFGRLAGTEAAAQGSAAALTRRIAALRSRYARTDAPTVLIQVWDHPIYTVGATELMTDVIEACGLRNLFEDVRAPGLAVTLESVLVRDPQVILALAPDQRSARDWLAGWRAYPSVRAVRTGRLVGWTDQRRSRLGPGIVDAAQDLCRALEH